MKIPRCDRLRLVLGDQLSPSHVWYSETDADTLYLVAELRQEATYTRHHVQKVVAFFAAMESFAGELREAGHRVLHLSSAHRRNEPAPGPARFVPPLDLERPGPLAALRFLHSRRAARACAELVRAGRPDVAHLHIYHGQLTPAVLGPLVRAGVPIVQTLHESKTICPVHTLLSRGLPCEACHGRHFHRALPRRCNRGSLARTAMSVTEAYLARWKDVFWEEGGPRATTWRQQELYRITPA